MKSRGLEAFRDILGIFCAVSGYEVDMNSERIQTVKKELERLEAIDNANPSEALKQLGDISYFIMEAYSDHEPLEENQKESRQCFMDYCKNIKQALLKAQEQEKALKIIKEKNVDIFHLRNKCDRAVEYNDEINIMYYCYVNCKELTQEEFSLLKEVLEND